MTGNPLARDYAKIREAILQLKLEGRGATDFELERDPCQDALIIRFRLLAPEAIEGPRRRFAVPSTETP